MLLTPLSLAAREPDLALWLLAPIVVPSILRGATSDFVRQPPKGEAELPINADERA